MKTLLTAACLALAPTLAATGEPSELDDLVIRTYDVGDLLPDASSARALVPIFPLVMTYRDDGPNDLDDAGAHELDWFLQTALMMIDDDGTGYSEHGWIDDDTLMLSATDAVHTAVGRLFDAIHAATHRRASVELTTWRLDDVADVGGGEPDGAIMSRRRVPLHVGRTHTFTSETSHTYLRTWEHGIAQNAAISVPQWATIDVGLHSVLRVEDVLGEGLRLRYVQRVSELHEIETRDLGIRAHVSLTERVESLRVTGALDCPHVAVGTAWGEASLPADGGTAWITTQVDTDAGAVSYATRVRVLGVEAAPAPIALGDDVAAWVVDGSHVRWPTLGPRAISRDRLVPEAYTHSDQGAWADATAIGYPSRHWGPVDELGFAIDELEYDTDVGLETMWFGSWMLMLGPEQRIADAAALTTTFGRGLAGLDVEVVVTRRERGADGSAGAETVARVRLPLDERGRAGAVVGHQTAVVSGYDVDVANSASVGGPIVMGVFDGLVVTCRDAGRDTVALDVTLHLRRADGELDLANDTLGPVDRLAFFAVTSSHDVPTDGRRHTSAEFAVEDDVAYDLHVTVTPR